MTQNTYDAFARVYDLQHSTFLDDVPMYLRLVRELSPNQPVLELGSGSGRVMIPLVEAGHRVVGVDESGEMLRLAQAHLQDRPHIPAQRYSLVQADARAVVLDERFGLVLIALNTFLHNATRDDQLATLRAARRHLVPGGALVVDLPPNDELAFQPDDGQFQFEATMIDPRTGGEIHKYVASRIFWATQEQELTYRITQNGPDEQFVSFRLRHVFKHEMELLLLHSGFEAPAWYGDYDLGPYGEGSPRMIAVARAVGTDADAGTPSSA
jgi:SAM-dependent methyltransferase